MKIKEFFDTTTYTLTYIVFDEHTLDGVIIDPVLDYDQGASKISTQSLQHYFHLSGRLDTFMSSPTTEPIVQISCNGLFRKVSQPNVGI